MSTWDHYGKRDPYYGVLSADEFRSERMDAQARDHFFELGARQVEQFIELAETVLGGIKFDTALDYGCGVGRLSRTLAARFRRVIAVDISRDMLAEAQRNLSDQQNVTYEHAERMSADTFDFLISKIVFQHIPPEHGIAILGGLARRLSDRGGGVIDFPVTDHSSLSRRSLRLMRRMWPFGEPIIPMYVYSLERIEATLRNAGMQRIHVQRAAAPPFEKAIVAFGR